MNHAISIDTETLGLGRDAQIIQIGAVIFDINANDSLAELEFLVSHSTYNAVELYAASMHAPILRELSRHAHDDYGRHTLSTRTPEEYVDDNWRIPCQRVVTVNKAADYLHNFIHSYSYLFNDKLTVTGKNYSSFDKPKLEKLPRWGELFRIRHRVIDPGNLWWNPFQDGAELPDTETCSERAGLPTQVKHTALADAHAVRQLIQRYTYKLELERA